MQYWAALTGVMIVIVVTTERFPTVLAPWQLSTTFAVVAVCLQPMVCISLILLSVFFDHPIDPHG
jgi:hypothetical protein